MTVDLAENAFRIPQISVFCCQINARIAADLLIKHASVRPDKGKHDKFIDSAEIDVGIAFSILSFRVLTSAGLVRNVAVHYE